MNLKAVLEGLLFVCGEEGISYDRLLKILDTDKETLDKLIEEYSNDLGSSDRGLQLDNYGSNYKLITKKEHSKYYECLADEEASDSLSPSCLEVLAIIAYNSPITRVMVDEIRGVSSAYLVRKLVLKNLIKEVGRSELPGRPILYGVTDQFLDYFGIKSVDELPSIDVSCETMESELFTSKYQEMDSN